MTAVIEHNSVRPPVSGRSTALVALQHRATRPAAVRIMRALGATDVLAATSVAEARRLASGRPADLTIVEAMLSDGSGSTLTRDLRAAGWRRTIVLDVEDDPFIVRGALAAGVPCYLKVDTAVPSTGTRPAPAPSGQVAGATASPFPVPSQRSGIAYGLSQREVDVLQLVAEGQSNREVGEKLGLSALTVKSHLARIARKLGTGDRAEMVVIALRASVIS